MEPKDVPEDSWYELSNETSCDDSELEEISQSTYRSAVAIDLDKVSRI